jgi:hypothetical protein
MSYLVMQNFEHNKLWEVVDIDLKPAAYLIFIQFCAIRTVLLLVILLTRPYICKKFCQNAQKRTQKDSLRKGLYFAETKRSIQENKEVLL